MGNSVLPPVSDVRIDKCVRKLKLKNEDINKLWLVFSAHDREGIGLITRKDFFDKIIEEPRTYFGDSILDFIESDNNDVLTFGEFVESICIFALFEKYDVLRFLFYLFDKKKVGVIDHDELKHFIIALHGGKVKSNAQMGLQSIEEKKAENRKFDFKELAILHRRFPHLLYPVFRLQTAMMRYSLGEDWWSGKKLILSEEAKQRKKLAANHLGHRPGNMDEEEVQRQLKVKEMMGPYKYYLMFWERKKFLAKLDKMEKLEKELAQQEAEFEADEAAAATAGLQY